MILEFIENGPLIWPSIGENGVTRPKKYSELSATEAIQSDCDVKATNIILQGLPPEVYALERKWKGNMSKQCTKPKRKRDASWFKDKVLLVQAQANGQILHEEELAFLADLGITEEALAEVHNPDNLDTNLTNQDVQAMLSSKQSNVVNHSETKITSDSNIIPYSQTFNRKRIFNANGFLLKNDFKKEESRNIDRGNALEKGIKQLDNIVFKRDQSAQTVYMLTKPQFFYDHITKQAVGFQNHFYLKKAQQLEPKLYDGNVIEKTSAIVIPDFEETLILAEASHSKMLLKQKDPMMFEKKVNTTPVDFDNSVNSPKPTFSSRPTIVEVPKELPKVSMVNTSLKKLKHHLAGFDVFVKERTIATAITEGSDNSISNHSAPSFDHYFELNELKAQSQEKDTVISKFKERITSVSDLKDDLRKLKGKALADDVVTSYFIASEMLNVDVEPLALKLLNNRTIHSDYLRHTQEQAAILNEKLLILIRQTCPRISGSNGVKLSTSASGSQPSGNTKNYKIQRPPRSTQKNKVKAHPRTIKSSLKNKNCVVKPKGTASVQHSNLNANFKLICVTCHGLGNACPLTRITTTTKVPSRKPIDVEIDTPKPVVTLVYSRKPRKSKSTDPVSKSKVIKSVPTNKKNPVNLGDPQFPMFHLPLLMNAEAVSTACYTQNRSIIRLRHGKTPYELLHDKLPDLSFFHVFDALYYLTNDNENLSKLQPKADIGIFVGYAPTKKAFWIYNRRTRRNIETIHVDFNELTTIASEHNCSGPVLHEMTTATISSGLVPSTPPSTPFVPPSRSDWDILFQLLFDELLTPPPSVDHPTPKIIALILAPEPAASNGSPSSTTVDQDEPSLSNSQTTPETQSLIIPSDVEKDNHDLDVAHKNNDSFFGIPIPEVPSDQSSSTDIIHTIVHLDHQISEHNSKWTKDHPLENIIGQLARPVSTRMQLHEQASFCYYDAFLTYVEPKTYKDALTQSCWIEAMQEELNELEAIRIFLAFAAHMNMVVYQIDVKITFQNGNLREEVYVSQPNEFGDRDNSNHVYKLKKALYGLKQALHVWCDMLYSFFISQDFSKGSLDPTVTFLSFRIVTESDPKEDPEEYKDDELEDGPFDYPMDGGDDGDDDDGDLSGDDADDEDEEKEDDEHLAPAYFDVVIPTIELISLPKGTEAGAISLPPEAKVERLLAMPTPPPSPLTSLSPPFVGERLARCTALSACPLPPPVPSPLLPSFRCPTQIQTLRMASTQALIDVVTAALPLPLLPPLPPPLYIPPPVNHRDDVPKTDMPPHKRLCLSTLGSRYEAKESSIARPTEGQRIDYGFISTLDAKARRRGIEEVGYGIRDTWIDPTEAVPEIAPMTLGEVNTRVTELAELHEDDIQDLYALLEDARDSRTCISQRVTMDSQRVDLLMEDRIAHQETILIVEEEAYAVREAWAHSI
uniref:Retrovirus-related Pol polyprotein from transposon TNT 1-94 n=1 Tax=Tanacetum cinerariifolium TaxID=118510 RepID=A0A6L2JT02_TANCI|nr:retrovirus-related Pol polyprotein from transposon TNT 1-94 [Tanacetum cinerariifolium]